MTRPTGQADESSSAEARSAMEALPATPDDEAAGAAYLPRLGQVGAAQRVAV
ncbi:MAG: hypothetical protein L0H96_14995 [Humibacillus sp.]|nr:hypothetical protein [Humibacillus sp.]MDN5778207.1 hypothetical protein [Humibacillus sp.]